MSLHEIREITWSTTPQELRYIASKMEAEWPHKRCGDSTTIEVIIRGELGLRIAFDQTKIGQA